METDRDTDRRRFVEHVMDDFKRWPLLSSLIALCALKENLPFNSEQRQELIKRVAKNQGIAKRGIQEIPNLTEAEKIQLHNTAR